MNNKSIIIENCIIQNVLLHPKHKVKVFEVLNYKSLMLHLDSENIKTFSVERYNFLFSKYSCHNYNILNKASVKTVVSFEGINSQFKKTFCTNFFKVNKIMQIWNLFCCWTTKEYINFLLGTNGICVFLLTCSWQLTWLWMLTW